MLAETIDACRNWSAEIDADGVCWLCIDKFESPVNVLSRDVLEEFEKIVGALRATPPTGLVIYSGKDKGFIAGADINEFPQLTSVDEVRTLVRRGQQGLNALSDLPCPSVAAMDGFALGGGLELALACDWRIAVDVDQRTLGLPEVKLGLHPGFGGTVRAVNLVGVRQAMQMMLAGGSVAPKKALKIGLIDKLTTSETWRNDAQNLVRRQVSNRKPPLLDRLLGLRPVRGLLAGQLSKTVARRAKPEHYPAPYAIIDLWQQYGADGAAAYEAEAASFAKLVETPASRNLVRVYFLQERLKHSTGSDGAEIKHVHVVGAGTMGGDIAAWVALRGFTVTLQDQSIERVQPALERAEKLFSKRLSDPGNLAETRARLVADVTGEGVRNADLIIEAIFEDRDVKQTLYRELEPRMKADAVLATNTSSIPLEELAPCLAKPERLIGLHFFNPVAKLPLVEVVSWPGSGSGAIAGGLSFTRQIGKLALPCKSSPGFLVNRILAPYMAEALELSREGVSYAEIDKAAVDFGMPMGPVELIDSVGIDVGLHVAEILSPLVGREVAPELKERVAAGHLGQKTGQGFYEYVDRRPVRPKGPVPVNEQAQERLVAALVNEAAACLADGVVADADLVDAGVIFGTGFAPFRGGPLHFAKSRGINAMVSSLERLEDELGPRFRPSSGWRKL